MEGASYVRNRKEVVLVNPKKASPYESQSTSQQNQIRLKKLGTF